MSNKVKIRSSELQELYEYIDKISQYNNPCKDCFHYTSCCGCFEERKYRECISAIPEPLIYSSEKVKSLEDAYRRYRYVVNQIKQLQEEERKLEIEYMSIIHDKFDVVIDD